MICSSSNRGRLNTFQRLMLHWSEVYPYNATHTYKIAGPVRLEQLRDAIVETNWHNKLGIVELSGNGQEYRHSFDPQPCVQVIGGGQRPDARLTAHLTKELNRPFERPRCRPFRFSVVEAGPEAHYLNVAYDHWVADSVAARLILGHVVGRYCGLKIPENESPLAFYSGTYRDSFASRWRGNRLAAAAWRSLRGWAEQRVAGRPAVNYFAPMDVRYEILRTSPGTVERLLAFARSCGVTVHDAILAALGRAMAEFLPRESLRRWRRGLGLGTIVDTRSDAGEDLGQSLGMFLAYSLIRCRPERAASLADLAQQVAALTGPVKAGRRHLDSLVSMKLCNAILGRLPNWYKPIFVQGVQPLDAGVSNVVVRNTWIDRYAAGHVLEYMRGASTGPTLPLVLSPTTLGDRMNVGVSYRVSAFSCATIQAILGRFLEQIENPGASRGVVCRAAVAPGSSATLARAA